MHFTQYYLDCLSHASYLIGDTTTGRAVVVDPRRDVQEYVDDAAANGLTIELVIETHFHADFLSGHLELAAATGAEIGFGEVAETEFPSRKLRDGERISLGEVTLEIRSTPGHTPESISVVVHETPDAETPYGVLTGDTMFIGDVGRPDLLASFDVTADELARKLYDSLHNKLLDLPDATKVFPAHGAGSACGKNLSTETVSTIGEQRRTNYALQDMTPDQFVAMVTADQPSAPSYFPYDAVLNRKDRALLDESITPTWMSFDEVVATQADGAVVLDVRDPEEFAHGHLHGSISVGIGGRFAEYAGTVVPHDTPIVLVGEPEAVVEAQLRLGRIGFDTVAGALEGGIASFVDHPEHVERASQVTAVDLRRTLDDGTAIQLVDIRNPGEVKLGSIETARPIPLAHLRDSLDQLDPAAPTVVFCAGGYRSSIAASLLRSQGMADVSDVLGGYGAWMATQDVPAQA
ncbi:MBL fold metallo-hydrolase [Actinomarinicola tropica]|uniref:MBL fold metallo-hydrolase n=1 Tax=Actinomarinicola tropica TaxID=2789776 RepID=A0A5Q2RFH0_9ACTN|nr:MBL fold metallo-hydrolase [Actinomarinicola tropica]QGG94443.1 MBL fold metallo-hydrolase [Actinomarinicola tropica]